MSRSSGSEKNCSHEEASAAPHCGSSTQASQEADHLVIGQMHAISSLINQHRNRGVGTCVGNVLGHLLHDEGIADHKPHNLRLVESRLLA
jgi:hypothetical protein